MFVCTNATAKLPREQSRGTIWVLYEYIDYSLLRPLIDSLGSGLPDWQTQQYYEAPCSLANWGFDTGSSLWGSTGFWHQMGNLSPSGVTIHQYSPYTLSLGWSLSCNHVIPSKEFSPYNDLPRLPLWWNALSPSFRHFYLSANRFGSFSRKFGDASSSLKS